MGFMEAKEFNLLPGCGLARNADGLPQGAADAEMLESTNSPENRRWLRQCNFFAGTSMLEARADRVEPGERSGSST
jgi:hypothetical protein